MEAQEPDPIDAGIIDPLAKVNATYARGDSWTVSYLEGGSYALSTAPQWVYDGSHYVPYIYEETENYYQVQSGVIGARIYKSGYTEFWNPNMTEVRLYEETWEVQYWSGNKWSVCDIYDPIYSVESDDRNINITASFVTDWPNSGERALTIKYIFREGDALKHEIEFVSHATETYEFRVIQKWAGIVASKVRHDNGEEVITSAQMVNSSRFRFLKEDGSLSIFENQWDMYYGEKYVTKEIIHKPTGELRNVSVPILYHLPSQSLKPVKVDVHAQGLKADFIFGNWTLTQDESLTIDPATYTAVPPTDDATISETSPGSNFGSATTIRIYWDWSAFTMTYAFFIKFSITAVPDTAAISTATMKLYVNSFVHGHTDLCIVTDNDWTEETVTYNDQPTGISNVGSHTVLSTGYVEFAPSGFASHVQNKLAENLASFYVYASTTNHDNRYYCDSKEDSPDPQLIIVYYVPPTVITVSATLLEDTTANPRGQVTATGGQNPTRYIQYGTSTGSYPFQKNCGVGGVGVYNGYLTGLTPGQRYFYRAKAVNSGGTSYGSEMNFYTRPSAPSGFTATAVEETQIDLAWTKGAGGDKTHIRRKIGSYPTSISDGDQAYFDTGVSKEDTGLEEGANYYYRGWAYDSDSGYYSSGYMEDCIVYSVEREDTTNADFNAGTHNDTEAVSDNLQLLSISGEGEDVDATLYCDSYETADYFWIERIVFVDIDETTGETPGGYEDNTDVMTEVIPNTSPQIIVYTGDDPVGSYPMYMTVWVDWDKDQLLTDETGVQLGTCTDGQSVQGNIPVPSGFSGSTLMRVSLKYASYSAPCEIYSYMEVEDYTVYAGYEGGYNVSGNYTSLSLDISALDSCDDSLIFWNMTLSGQSLSVYSRYSTNGGTNWSGWASCTNGSAMPGVGSIGESTSNALVQYSVNMTGNGSVTPLLHDITFVCMFVGTEEFYLYVAVSISWSGTAYRTCTFNRDGAQGVSLSGEAYRTLGALRSPTQGFTLSGDVSRQVDTGRTLAQSVTLASSTSRLWQLLRGVEQSISCSGEGYRTLWALRSPTQDLTLLGDALRQVDTGRNPMQSLSLASSSSRLWQLLKTAEQALSLTPTAERGWSLMRGFTQSMTMTFNGNRLLIALRGLTQTITATVSADRVLAAIRTLVQSLDMTSSIGRTWSTTRVLTQAITSTFNTERLWNLMRGFTQGVSLTFNGDRILTAVRGLSQGISTSFNGERMVALIRMASQGMTTSFGTERLWSTTRTMFQAVSMSSNTGRLWNTLRSVSQEISTTFNGERVLTALRGLAQGLSFTFNGERVVSLIRWGSQTISTSFNTFRSWTLLKTVSQTLSLGLDTDRSWSTFRLLTQTIYTTLNSGRLWDMMRDITQGISLNLNGERLLTAIRSLPQSLAITFSIERVWSTSRTITQGISAFFNSGRLWTLSRTVSQSLSTVFNADRLWSLTRAASQAIMVNMYTGRLVAFIRDPAQSLTMILDLFTYLHELDWFRELSMTINIGLEGLRTWSLSRTFTQGLSFISGALAFVGEMKMRLVSLSIQVTIALTMFITVINEFSVATIMLSLITLLSSFQFLMKGRNTAWGAISTVLWFITGLSTIQSNPGDWIALRVYTMFGTIMIVLTLISAAKSLNPDDPYFDDWE